MQLYGVNGLDILKTRRWRLVSIVYLHQLVSWICFQKLLSLYRVAFLYRYNPES